MAPPRARIPVYLLTGFLGSGKTTLLSAWLKQPALQDAAVIVNELGEVGLDNALLGVAGDGALLSGNCVCCTGLPGLEQALEDLFWARLQRRMPAFPAVAIETTGLADPAPVVRAFEEHPLLRERYQLAAVVTIAGAAAGADVIDRHEEAQAQARAAHALVMTKTDEASAGQLQALRARLQALNPHAPVLVSNHADLALDAVLHAIRHDGCQHGHEPSEHGGGHAHHHHREHTHEHGHDGHAHEHGHDHHHAAQASFLALPQAVERDWLVVRLHRLASALGGDLLRLKGFARLADGSRCVVQYAPDQARFDLLPAAGEPGQADGLTVIALHADAPKIASAFFKDSG